MVKHWFPKSIIAGSSPVFPEFYLNFVLKKFLIL